MLANISISYTFSHGWGCEASFWEPLLSYVSVPYTVWERGYYTKTPQQEILTSDIHIGIGHSLGLVQLLTSGIHFDAYIGIQSFVHFLGDTAMYRERKAMLDTMYAQLLRKPKQVLRNFCKHNLLPPPQKDFCLDALEEDFSMLYKTYTHFLPEKKPLCIMASTNDTVVPKQVIKNNFPNTVSHIIKDSGHALGFLYPAKVAELLETFVQKHFS